MTVRFACEKDIPQMNSLLYQVERVHQQGRPDLFKEGAKKYTDNELKDMLKDKTKPIFAAVDENDVMKGYAFCVFQEHKGDNVLTDIKTLYIDDLCVDENCRGQHIGSVLYEAVKKFAKEQGCYNVTLNVWECNPSARKFYEKSRAEAIQDRYGSYFMIKDKRVKKWTNRKLTTRFISALTVDLCPAKLSSSR